MAGGWQKGTTPGRASLGGPGTREDSELPTATRTQPCEVARVRVRARLRAGQGWRKAGRAKFRGCRDAVWMPLCKPV